MEQVKNKVILKAWTKWHGWGAA